MVELHQDDVHNVENKQNYCFPHFNRVSYQKYGDDSEIEEDEDGVSGDDPPVDPRVLVCN
jgi:hypothetical protein